MACCLHCPYLGDGSGTIINDMKHILIFVQLFIICLVGYAQPAAVKNAGKSVFTLSTFKADGSLLSTSRGVFIDNEGTAVSAWTPFAGADHAVVVDASGKRMDVDYIFGANDLHDMVKFHVAGKTTGCKLSTGGVASGGKVWLLDFAKGKSNAMEGTVSKKETFSNKYNYYVISLSAPENTESCPFVDANGQVVGLMQPSKTTSDIHATDVRFAADFQVSGLSANDPLLRSTNIPAALPSDKDQALLSMMLTMQQDNPTKYGRVVDLFLNRFPTAVDGYNARAQQQVDNGQYADAARTMETAIAKCTPKDEAHYDYARIIYQKMMFSRDTLFTEWTLDKAMSEAKAAHDINPLPLYKHLQAQIVYSQGDFQGAYDQFMALTNTNFRNPELFLEASQCKQRLQAPQEECLALLDSAIATCRTPLTSDAAPYFLARATALDEAGQYRRAVVDYNQYDSLMLGRVGADFFFQREQCEVKARMFQQALDDIARAIILTPGDPMLLAEMANLQIRVNKLDDALKTTDAIIRMAPDYDEGYLLKGLAQVQLGQKKEGLENLRKAQEKGNEQAAALIAKYQ